MKKLILIILFLMPLLMKGQVIYQDVYFYADSVSQTLDLSKVGKGAYLEGMFVNDSFDFETLTFNVSPDGSTWYGLYSANSAVSVSVDSTVAFGIPLAEANFRPWKYFQFLIPADIADTNYVKVLIKKE